MLIDYLSVAVSIAHLENQDHLTVSPGVNSSIAVPLLKFPGFTYGFLPPVDFFFNQLYYGIIYMQ